MNWIIFFYILFVIKSIVDLHFLNRDFKELKSEWDNLKNTFDEFENYCEYCGLKKNQNG
ncbi:hypothetical protein [Helicobacter cetorum]|nr:hypothetical protein [Helicobacter cetorum]